MIYVMSVRQLAERHPLLENTNGGFLGRPFLEMTLIYFVFIHKSLIT